MELLFVIAIFDSGDHQGYWCDDENDCLDNPCDATIHDCRKTAEESLGEIPRKYDARIFSLQLSPAPKPVSEDQISQSLPEFLTK
jgi:hypothetical protein